MKVKALNLTDFSIDQLRQNGYMPWLCSLKYLHFILMVAYIPAKGSFSLPAYLFFEKPVWLPRQFLSVLQRHSLLGCLDHEFYLFGSHTTIVKTPFN